MSGARPAAVVAMLLATVALAAAACGEARADEPSAANQSAPARFAIVVGTNQSVDHDVHALRYADDDAAGYLELFRGLGARTYLLSRFDESTRRLHPQAAAEAMDPRRRELDRVVDQIASDVAMARRRGLPTVVYFVFDGHGGVENGRGYLALEDDRLYGADLERLIVERVGGGETHFIVDACYSVFLAFSRGPGGDRRPVHGFAALGGLGARPGVGLLLSTSSARESQEWSEFQAGVFSHEVRSGLLGAADANGDGRISYREIAAFINRANSPIPNDRFRPEIYAKAPASEAAILDLRTGLARRFEIDGAHPGHYFVEDSRGVRLADFHNASGQSVHLVRPASLGRLFLRRLGPGNDVEYVVEAAPAVVRIADLQPQATTIEKRGALQESFRLLFALPFSQEVVDAFVEARAPDFTLAEVPGRVGVVQRVVALSLLGLGAAAAAGGTLAIVSAVAIERHPDTTQADTFQANALIDRRNEWARALYGISGAALVVGGVLLLWPTPEETPTIGSVQIDVWNRGGGFEWRGRF
ncbi:MAG: hypothetical protein ABJA82_04695 [Myxococcales bacterium]